MNIGRNAALAAGFPDTVPGTTVDRQCGSAQQAVHFAAQAVAVGGHGHRDRRRGRGHEPGAHRVDDRARPRRRLRSDRPRPVRLHPPGPLSAEEIARPLGHHPRGDGPLRPAVPRAGRRAPSPRAASRTRSCRWPPGGPGWRTRWPWPAPTTATRPTRARSPSTRASGPARPTRSWRRCRPCFVEDGLVTAGSRRRRSPTGRPPCSSCPRSGPPGSGLHAPGPLPHLRGGGQRPGHHAHRPHPGDHARAREGEAVARRHRPDRDQRGLRLGGPGLGEGAPPRHGHRSTRTAAPSPSVTRPGARGRACWPPCSTRSSAPAAATGSRPCARAAARPTPPSSSAWAEPTTTGRMATRAVPAGSAAGPPRWRGPERRRYAGGRSEGSSPAVLVKSTWSALIGRDIR